MNKSIYYIHCWEYFGSGDSINDLYYSSIQLAQQALDNYIETLEESRKERINKISSQYADEFLGGYCYEEGESFEYSIKELKEAQ